MAPPGAKKRQRDTEEASPAVADTAAEAPSKKAKLDKDKIKSLFVRSLPAKTTSESLTEFFSQHYPIKHATVVLDPLNKTSKGYGFVTFADPDDAIEAKAKLNNQMFDGRKLRLDIAQPRQRDASKKNAEHVKKIAAEKKKRDDELAESKKAPKLIIRNLPWSIKKPEQLSALFKQYGKVKFSDLPNDHGKLSGFGFITLRGKKNAETAMKALNGMVVDGRTIAVDYAVDKETWDKQRGVEDSDDDNDDTPAKTKKSSKSKKAKDVPEEDEEEEEEEDPNMTQEDRDLANFFKNHMENIEDEGSAEEDEDSEDEDKDEDEDEDDENEDDAELSELDEDDEDSEIEGGADLAEEKEAKPARITDNSTTLFVRNLPYTATDETMKEQFSKFGPVRYARVVMDRAQGRPTGTGFVCFFNVEDFNTCLKGAPRYRADPSLNKLSVLQDETVDQEGKYTLDGRILQVAQAVNKEEAARLESDGVGGRNRKDQDKRRLYLLTEGNVPTNSPLFAKLSASEVKMREDSLKQRKKLIQNSPSLHLSLTRLALRNLPHSVDSKQLKQLAREAVVGFAKDVKEGRREPLSKEENARGGAESKEAERRRKEKGKGVVSQAKVVFESREGSKVSDVGEGKSRGYGFIEYSSHRWALMGLRYLNGHPLKNEAGKTQRLIVEFAIENAGVIQRRRALEEKSKTPSTGGPRPSMSQPISKYNPNRKDTQEAEFHKAKREAKKSGVAPPWKQAKDAEAKEAKKGGEGKAEASAKGKAAKKPVDPKLALRTKIIARKRTLRRKKAGGK
ncbi:hypothetical protein B0T22DRAFT_447652 [Podospora appendiculata]|uniref:RRM domain-containing protein n=1 Tax=Podospora appendiculata TaxID=314037 RepID=A0AAE0XFN5_9PEZI|nr:hypothetical protein B0T22DRAFT_447652 [Podospora appendiculata]